MPRLTIGFLIVGAAVVILGGLMLKTYSGGAAPPAALPQARDEFAAERNKEEAVPFDAERAMGYLKTICKIGPRMSNTEGMRKQQELIKKHFEEQGARVEFQRFTARQKSQAQPAAMANVIISWHPERTRSPQMARDILERQRRRLGGGVAHGTGAPHEQTQNQRGRRFRSL
jgi:hypothetical protein